MQIELNEYKKGIYCLILLLILILATIVIKKYFTPFIIILVLIYICLPIYNLLAKKKIFNSKINAILCILLANILIFITAFLIGNFIYNTFSVFASSLSSYEIEKTLFHMSGSQNLNLLQVGDKLRSFILNILNSDFLKRGAVYTTNGIFAYLISNIAAYFILSDMQTVLMWVKRVVPSDKLKYFYLKFNDINNMIGIEFILVLITTLQTIVGFLILGVKNSVSLGVMCGILDVLPYIGTIFIFVPLVIIYIIKKQYIIAAGLVILYILLNTSRQILEAKFMSSKLRIHPLLIILSLYIGIKAFGPIGMMTGPLYILCAKEIINN